MAATISSAPPRADVRAEAGSRGALPGTRYPLRGTPAPEPRDERGGSVDPQELRSRGERPVTPPSLTIGAARAGSLDAVPVGEAGENRPGRDVDAAQARRDSVAGTTP